MTIRRVAVAAGSGLMAFLIALGARAAGFDDTYKVYQGHLNNDDKLDLYVRSSRAIVIPVDDMPIVIGPPVRDFVLQTNGQNGFTILGQLTPEQRMQALQWQPAEQIDVFTRDVDLDGYTDLDLVGIGYVAAGYFDLIAYAPTQRGAPPSLLTSKNNKFSRFHEHLFGWLRDNNYFQANAPQKITSIEPGQRWWFGSIADPTNTYLMNKWLADCRVRYPGYVCALSDRPPPPPCERTVPQTDDQGNYVGTGPSNICEKPIHVIIYTPGTIQTSPDYSVFDTDARETADILVRINAACPAIPATDAERLAQIAELIYQHAILRNVPPADKMNSFQHAPFPGDELFNTADKTYHHYDVRTRICGLSEANCNMAVVRDDAGRSFSYPAFMLRRHFTPIPGPAVTAYITAPALTSVAVAYVIPAGPITQRFVESGQWVGATQNITQVNHVVYPGTISRYIELKDNTLYAFTHGVGINRAFCSLAPEARPYNIFLAAQNDANGPKAFKQLDRELIKYWKRNFSPAGAPTDPLGPARNAADIPSPNQ